MTNSSHTLQVKSSGKERWEEKWASSWKWDCKFGLKNFAYKEEWRESEIRETRRGFTLAENKTMTDE